MADEQKNISASLTDQEFLQLSEEDKLANYKTAINYYKDTLNNWKRAAADFENFKKRRDAESKELIEFAKEATAMQLLPSLQSLEQVLKFAPADEKYKNWLEGLKATIMQLERAMEALGLAKIKTAGEKFDPHLHEAVEESEGEEGKIIKEIQHGFMLNEKVIIPAKVVVGKMLKNNK